MSYILEALKKSQRDRELGQVPDLTTEFYTDTLETKSSMGPWIISSVVIALVALLIALYAVFGRQLDAPKVPEIQVQDPMLNLPQISEPAAPKAKEQATTPSQPQKAIASIETEVQSTARPVAPVQKKIPQQTPKEKVPATPPPIEPPPRQTEVERIRQEYAQMQAQEKQQPKIRSQEREAPASVSPPPAKKAAAVTTAHPAAHELPTDVRSRIPPRNIMLQSYSENPADRFVIMNSVKLHQGQSTADGLQVLEIRVDGLLLGFEGYEFFQPR